MQISENLVWSLSKVKKNDVKVNFTWKLFSSFNSLIHWLWGCLKSSVFIVQLA